MYTICVQGLCGLCPFLSIKLLFTLKKKKKSCSYWQIDCMTIEHTCRKGWGHYTKSCKDRHGIIPITVSLCPDSFGHIKLKISNSSQVQYLKAMLNLHKNMIYPRLFCNIEEAIQPPRSGYKYNMNVLPNSLSFALM